MDHNVPVTVLLLVVSCIPTSYLLRQFHYVNLTMNWSDAQQYCRAKYTDLATFKSLDDLKSLNRPALSTTVAWIGLNDDPKSWRGVMGNDANSWRWSATGATSSTGFQSWNPGEPNDNVIEYCVWMFSNGRWNDITCTALLSFICYTETAQKVKTYVYVSLALTWFDARNYCRANFADLPTIENSVDNENVRKRIPSNSVVWIGLYRLAWKWSDGSSSLFRNWQSNEPDNSNDDQYCVTEDDQHQWNDDSCEAAYVFMCHKDLKEHMITVRLKIQTSAGMTDPATNAQLLQKVDVELRSLGVAYVTLQWTSQPRKQETLTHPQCTFYV